MAQSLRSLECSLITTIGTIQEPAQGPWVPFDEGRFEGPDEADNGASEEAGSSGERPAYLHARPRWPGASDGSEDDDAQIVPIKSLDTGVINVGVVKEYVACAILTHDCQFVAYAVRGRAPVCQT